MASGAYGIGQPYFLQEGETSSQMSKNPKKPICYIPHSIPYSGETFIQAKRKITNIYEREFTSQLLKKPFKNIGRSSSLEGFLHWPFHSRPLNPCPTLGIPGKKPQRSKLDVQAKMAMDFPFTRLLGFHIPTNPWAKRKHRSQDFSSSKSPSR